VKVIRQNIVWFAFGVNLVGIILTGWVWPLLATAPGWFEKAPLVGVLYHQIGSVAVLLNSMRLLGFERAATSPTLKTVRGRLKDFDQWLGSLHFEDVLHWLSHRWKPIAVGAILVAAVSYAATGVKSRSSSVSDAPWRTWGPACTSAIRTSSKASSRFARRRPAPSKSGSGACRGKD
jgi:Cu+-exporting ATPase